MLCHLLFHLMKFCFSWLGSARRDVASFTPSVKLTSSLDGFTSNDGRKDLKQMQDFLTQTSSVYRPPRIDSGVSTKQHNTGSMFSNVRKSVDNSDILNTKSTVYRI
jgi:hypothetical protein